MITVNRNFIKPWILIASCLSLPLLIGPFCAFAQGPGIAPLSKQTMAQIDRSQTLGKKIFENDKASAAATDSLMAWDRNFRSKNIRGWVTVEKEKSWLVRFFNDKNLAIYDVILPKDDFKKVEYSKNDPGKALSKSELRMAEARQLAIKANFQKCGTNLNTVILDGKEDKKKGFLVYILAASTNADDVTFGGNYLLNISEDARKIIETRPFTTSCITLSKKSDPMGRKPTSLVISQLLTDYPTEIHVFLSMLHQMQFYVGTKSNNWLVDGDIITTVAK